MLGFSSESASQRMEPAPQHGCNFGLRSSTFLSMLCYPPAPSTPVTLGQNPTPSSSADSNVLLYRHARGRWLFALAFRDLGTRTRLGCTVQQRSTVTDNYDMSHVYIFNCLIATLKKSKKKQVGSILKIHFNFIEPQMIMSIGNQYKKCSWDSFLPLFPPLTLWNSVCMLYPPAHGGLVGNISSPGPAPCRAPRSGQGRQWVPQSHNDDNLVPAKSFGKCLLSVWTNA